MAEKIFMRSTGLLDQCARAVKYCGARVISHVAQMACSRFGIEGNTVLFESFLGGASTAIPRRYMTFSEKNIRASIGIFGLPKDLQTG